MPLVLLAATLRPALDRLRQSAFRQEADRDLRFDFLRGFCVLAMVVDHLAGASLLTPLTGGNRFYTSAAEGFVFISGLIVGLVYRRFAEREGLGSALRRLIERSWQLYTLTVAMTLLLVPASELLGLPWAQGIDLSNPLQFVVGVATLHQTYYLADIPLLYTLLLMAAVPLFVLLHEGRTWIVLAASWLLWASHQLFPEQTDLPWPIAGNYLFYFSAWQVIFVTGMVIGYHRSWLAARLRGAWPNVLLLGSAIGFAVLIALYHSVEPLLLALAAQDPTTAGAQSPALQLVDLLLAKGYVRPGRIVASLIVFSFFFLLTTALWRPLQRWLGWLLVPLGQSALLAYSLHVVLAVALGLLTTRAGWLASDGLLTNTVVQLASLGLIWGFIRLLAPFPRPGTKRWWTLSPAPIALTLLLLLPLNPSPDRPGLEAPQPAAQAITRQTHAARVFGSPVPRAPESGADPAARPRQPAPVPPPPRPPAAVAAPTPSGSAAPAGTPGPAAAPQPPGPLARIVGTPVPLPPPPPRASLPLPGGEPVVSPYVGALQGAFREVEFASRALDRDERYFIYLPPDYKGSGRRYPVLYLLHGGSGDKEEWAAYGVIDAVDRLIVAQEIRPLIVVLPQGDWGYWVNHVGGGPRWGDYLADDLVRHIDASFRTLPDPAHRAIGGLSMGGHGALQLAFNRPDVFGVAGAHSPSLRPEDGELPFLGTGDEFAARDPISLAQSAPGIERLIIWLDAGDEDPWIERIELLHRILEDRGIPHSWSILPGEHGGAYWEQNLVTYLRFYDAALNGAKP